MQIVILSQGVEEGFQVPSINLGMNTGIEAALRSLGCVFGMNRGSAGGSVPGNANPTVVQTAQHWLSALITEFNAPQDLDGGYDWLSVNNEGEAMVENMIRGGAGVGIAIPERYPYFDRVPATNSIRDSILAQAAEYGYATTAGTLTFGQLHDTLIRANRDTCDWVRTQAPAAMVAFWGKHNPGPIPFTGNGWWNIGSATVFETLDNGFTYPTRGTDSLTKWVEGGLRTMEGAHCWTASNTAPHALSQGTNNWTTSLASYPTGSHQARAYAKAFEVASNYAAVARPYDAIPSQDYLAIYPASRPLTSIPNLGVDTTGAPADLTLGWTTGYVPTNNPNGTANRYVRRADALSAVYAANRLNWLSSWKTFGSKASFGTEMTMDSGGSPSNPFNLLGTEIDDFEATFIDAVFDPLTSTEASRYGLPSALVGKSLMPARWFFWTAEAFFLRQAFTGGTLTGDPLARTRSNLEWRFGGTFGGSLDWAQGSAWHQHIAAKLDEFALERIGRLRQRYNQEAMKNAATQTTLLSLVGN